jgi:hypothetical protein
MFDLGIINIYEVIELLISLIALAIIFVASIKLFKNKNIPKSNLILIAFVGSIIGVFLPLIETYFIIEESYIFGAIVDIYLSLMFLLGAYGFWCFVGYSTNEKC